jgi:hypothetical protein
VYGTRTLFVTQRMWALSRHRCARTPREHVRPA